MRKRPTRLAPAGIACTFPSLTRELAGRLNSTIDVPPSALLLRRSVHARLRRDVLGLVGQRIRVHRSVAERDPAALVDPGERVLHPVLVVARGEVLARACASAFLARLGGVE